MDNSMLKRGTSASSNFNNMTDEQLQEWRTAFMSEAQRENYVNHNLEIVRHYRTEAIARAPAFDYERNAIDAAIARHGLCSRTPAALQEDVQPPPMRRPRIEQSPQNDASGSGVGATANFGHYVALAHIFSDAYSTRGRPAAAAAAANGNINSTNSSSNRNLNNNNALAESEISELNDIAITKTIDSLGLRRT